MAEKAKQHLTSSRRANLNSMVAQVNDRILNVTMHAGLQVVYVNNYCALEQVNSCFCEEGIEEPGPNRARLRFYEWTTFDGGEEVHLINILRDHVPHNTFEG